MGNAYEASSSNWPIWTVYGTTEPIKDQWYHGVFVVDKNNLILYLDGEKDGERTIDETYTINNALSVSNIGYTGMSGSKQYFDGSIDEVMIYDRALSAEEVKALYDIQKE